MPFIVLLLISALSASVFGQGAVSVYPSSLTFRQTANVLNNVEQVAYVFTPGGPQSCTVSVNSAVNVFAVAPATATTPFVLHVASTAYFVPPNTYAGVVRISCQGSLQDALLTLTTEATPAVQLIPTPERLFFNVENRANVTLSKQFYVDSTNQAVAITPTLLNPAPWINFDPNFPTSTIQTFFVRVRPTNNFPGVYTNTIRLIPPTGLPFELPVTLESSAPSPISFTKSLEFQYQEGGLPPVGKPIDLISLATNAVYQADVSYDLIPGISGDQPKWISILNATGTTPASMLVTASPTGLPRGSHRANIRITSPGVPNPVADIPVTFVVGPDPTVAAEPRPLNFNYRFGTDVIPEPQTLHIDSPREPLQFVANVVTDTYKPWLIVTPSLTTAPTDLTVTVDPANLPAGVYEGSIEVAGANSRGVAFRVPVRLNISDSNLAVVPLERWDIVHPIDKTTTRYTQLLNIRLLTNGPTPRWRASVLISNPANGNWLSISSNEGIAPWSLGLAVDAAGLAPGTYWANIYFRYESTYDVFQVLPVKLVVTDKRPLQVSPSALVLTKDPAGPNPSAVGVTLSTKGEPYDVLVKVVALNGQPVSWLSVTPSAGPTPLTVRVSANGAGLQPFARRANIIFTPLAPGIAPVTVPVDFIVAAPNNLSVSPQRLDFATKASDAATPAPVTLNLASVVANVPVQILPTTDAGGNWLRATINNDRTPAAVTVTVDQRGLKPGTYTGKVQISSPGSDTVVVPISLAVNPGDPGKDLAIANGASFLRSAFAPGTLVTFFGTNIGPPQLTGLQVVGGKVSTTLANTQVLFDDIAAPLIYASATQTTAVVPFELAGRTSARLRVIYQGTTYYDQPVAISSASPGLFTANSGGSGQAAVLNQDGSANSASNAAAKGSVLQIFATGGGATNPASVTGGIATSVATLTQDVRVVIGGQEAVVQYSGQAPSLVNGVIQINAVIPAAVVPGNSVPVQVIIGGQASQSNATVAVR